MNNCYADLVDDDEREERIAEYLHRRRYEKAMRHAPDCRDPAHPGCEYCEPENFTT